jgi:hypothetical protein
MTFPEVRPPGYVAKMSLQDAESEGFVLERSGRRLALVLLLIGLEALP